MCCVRQAGQAGDVVWERISREADEMVDLSALALHEAVEQVPKRVATAVSVQGGSHACTLHRGRGVLRRSRLGARILAGPGVVEMRNGPSGSLPALKARGACKGPSGRRRGRPSRGAPQM